MALTKPSLRLSEGCGVAAGHVTIAERFAAGGLAGAASQLAIYPLEVVKTRMAVSPSGTYTVWILS